MVKIKSKCILVHYRIDMMNFFFFNSLSTRNENEWKCLMWIYKRIGFGSFIRFYHIFYFLWTRKRKKAILQCIECHLFFIYIFLSLIHHKFINRYLAGAFFSLNLVVFFFSIFLVQTVFVFLSFYGLLLFIKHFIVKSDTKFVMVN